jgi:hypothetical protein
MTPPASQKGYKRSWKNLLINKRYQLRFTLFMVGLSSALMIGLGVWVMRVANETTDVSKTSVRGTPCPKIPLIADASGDEAPTPAPAVPMKLDDTPPTRDAPAPAAGSAEPAPAPPAEPATGSAAPPPGNGAAAGAPPPGEEPPRRRATVQIDESTINIMPTVAPVPPDFGVKVVDHWACELRLIGKLEQLDGGRLRILIVLVLTGLLLVLFLAVYGIKMTHKVAGPLFKVGLYLNKMRQGRFDKVYNLRKGDQLVDFYEHFKHAHAGVVQMEKDDIERIKAVIAAAESAGAGEHATIVELREVVARKEKSLE